MNTVNRGCWLAMALACLAAACNANEPAPAVPASAPAMEQVQQRQVPGPLDCITHTTLAQLPTLGQAELLEQIRAIPQVALRLADRTAAQAEVQVLNQEDLEGLAIEDSLVGILQVGQDAMLVWRSPQYHDCQDLIEVGAGSQGDSLVYTSRVGVLATVEAQVIQDNVFQALNTIGIRVAFVQRLIGADYANLRLDRDSACIYVAAPDTREGPDWRAAVLDCSGPAVVWASVPDERKLQVTRLTYANHPQFTFTDFPPVARWEWDTADSVQAYGFKCGSGWCLAGVDRPAVDMTEYGGTAAEIIHGYRDEQFLADSTATVPSEGWPSRIWAVLVPHPALAGVTKAAMKAPNGFPAAVVHVRGLDPRGSERATAKYIDKYGFDPSDGTDMVRIFFADTVAVSIRRMNTPIKTRNMVYRNLGSPPVPAVRWAWSLSDEDQWLPCPEGCCETVDGFN